MTRPEQMTRKEVREALMQLLFQMEAQSDYSREAGESYLEKHIRDPRHKAYAARLIDSVISHLDDIDRRLDENSRKKNTKRMAKVDLAIARLALGEVLYMDDIPHAVAINEAVDMAKKYSADESRKFINGILGQIVKQENE